MDPSIVPLVAGTCHGPRAWRTFREGPFAAATPHPRIGDNKGGCAYRFTTYRDYDFADQDGHFGVQMCNVQGLRTITTTHNNI